MKKNYDSLGPHWSGHILLRPSPSEGVHGSSPGAKRTAASFPRPEHLGVHAVEGVHWGVVDGGGEGLWREEGVQVEIVAPFGPATGGEHEVWVCH